MKKCMYIAGLAATLVLGMQPTMSVVAAGPVADRENSGYDDQTWSRLQDDVLEYDEIPLLVHECNTSIRKIWDDMEKVKRDMLANVEELESQARKMKDLKDAEISDGNYEDAREYAIQEGTLDAIAKGTKNGTIRALNSKSSLASIQRGEDQITQVAQSLMISYDTLRQQRNTLEHLQRLYSEQYQLAVNKRNLGLATDAEVLAAQADQLTAQNNIASIDSALLKMKPTLLSLTGWAADADPAIAAIPAVDLSQIDHIDLAADTVKAIGNNTTMMELRRSEAAKTNDGVAARLAKIEEGEQKVTIELKTLYDDIFAKKAAYEAAVTGYQSAQKSKASYDRMYNLGMMSKSEYLGAQISYYQKEASFESADTALRLSIETYQWAVRGFLDIDA